MLHVKIGDVTSLAEEENQQSAIRRSDGMQEMLIQVGGDLEGDSALWLFPIPSSPDEAEIDIHKDFPNFRGMGMEEKLADTASGAFTAMAFSQVYTVPLHIVNNMFASTGQFGDNYRGAVGVHESVEKRGLTAQLITAENADALTLYLEDKGLDLPGDSYTVLQDYIGNNYSFVVAWVSDLDKYRKSQPISYVYYLLKNSEIRKANEFVGQIDEKGRLLLNIYLKTWKKTVVKTQLWI